MKRLFVRACCVLAVSLRASSALAALALEGADTLEEVTRDAISLCGLNASFNYLGGGSALAEKAMVGGTQQIAPMDRQLAGPVCSPTASQLLVGLDGISIVTSNQYFGDSIDETSDDLDNCSDAINGGVTLSVPNCAAVDGCTTAGSYVLNDWKDVLALVYGGQNHTAAAQLINGSRNIHRINCAGIVRTALVNSWGTIFADDNTNGLPCRATQCAQLKHAFRLGDLSGTTDTFVSLVGLVPVPPFTTTSVNNSPTPDANATANPFCNAGERLMNKGDADYLDLDPIRRAVDTTVINGNHFGLEQVGELVPAFGGLNNDANCMRNANAIPADHASTTEPGIWPDPNIANSEALLKADLGVDSVNGGLLPVPYASSTRLCLGLVLPVVIPANYQTPQQAYFADTAGAPVPCDILNPPGVGPSRAADFVSSDSQHVATALCPDGTHQPCVLPYKVDPNAPNGENFNCFMDQVNPNLSGVQDMRAFNLHPLDVTGHYLRDNYFNPNLSLNATRQSRVVSAFFRLHVSRATNLVAPPTEFGCSWLTSTEQVGCLVEANPCSIGFAGREAVDNIANLATELGGIRASNASIGNLVNLSGLPVYPFASRLWLSASAGFSSVTGDQLSLLNCFQGLTPGVALSDIDAVVSNRNFVPVPSGTPRARSCPASP